MDTPRARLAAVTKRLQDLWALLQDLRRLLRNFFTRRIAAAVNPTGVAGAPGGVVVVQENQDPPQPRVPLRMAALYDRPRNQRRPAPAEAPASSAPASPRLLPLQEMNGVTITRELQDRYVEYCQRTASCPKNKSVCHMCVFVQQLARDCTVRNKGIILHCSRKHNTTGFPCPEHGCYIRIGKEEDVAWHVRYCHELSGEWWLQKNHP